MTDRETRIVEALSLGPAACVALAAELARPFVQKPRKSEARTKTPIEAPAPLTDFFAALGATTAVGIQDRLVAPADWALDDGKLAFAEENQNVCEWACDPSGDDPRVYYRHHRASAWADDHVHLSEFLLRFVTVECVFGAEEAESAPCLPDARLALVLERMRLLPFADGQWPGAPTRLYARGDVLSLVSPNGEGLSTIFVGAETREELAFLDDIADGDWD